MADAHAICSMTGVQLKGRRHPRTMFLPPKVTFSGGTIRSIADRHGEEHACMVLEAIISAPQNETQLFGGTIKAVSLWLSEGWKPKDSPIVHEYLSTISLCELKRQVKELDLAEWQIRMADRLAAGLQNDEEWRWF